MIALDQIRKSNVGGYGNPPYIASKSHSELVEERLLRPREHPQSPFDRLRMIALDQFRKSNVGGYGNPPYVASEHPQSPFDRLRMIALDQFRH
jgi:hypothetical protein